MAYAHTETAKQSCEHVSQGPAGFAKGLVARSLEALLTWQQRASERAQLAGLDDHYLKDMGLSRADVEQETSKAFWQA